MFLLSLLVCIRSEIKCRLHEEQNLVNLFTLNLTCSKIIPNHIYSVIKTPLLIHIKYSQTYTEAILIVLSFYCPLKKKRKKKKNRRRKVPLELLPDSL